MRLYGERCPHWRELVELEITYSHWNILCQKGIFNDKSYFFPRASCQATTYTRHLYMSLFFFGKMATLVRASLTAS